MERGDVVVVVPVYGARELFEKCLRSVVAHHAGHADRGRRRLAGPGDRGGRARV